MRQIDTERDEEDWLAAEEALKAAQQMPAGPERIAALKRAGRMRFDACKKKRAVLDLMARENERLRHGRPRD